MLVNSYTVLSAVTIQTTGGHSTGNWIPIVSASWFDVNQVPHIVWTQTSIMIFPVAERKQK